MGHIKIFGSKKIAFEPKKKRQKPDPRTCVLWDMILEVSSTECCTQKQMKSTSGVRFAFMKAEPVEKELHHWRKISKESVQVFGPQTTAQWWNFGTRHKTWEGRIQSNHARDSEQDNTRRGSEKENTSGADNSCDKKSKSRTTFRLLIAVKQGIPFSCLFHLSCWPKPQRKRENHLLIFYFYNGTWEVLESLK